MERVIDVTDVILRDAHQSLLATRMGIDDMIPACGDLDAAGYWSLECWGGATYDACIRYLNEDPWERLRTFRKLLPNTKLQMLLRGQNLLGYRHYEDGVVQRFVEKCAVNGMDVFRVFDALNDVRNMGTALQAVKDTGKHAQATLCYTVSPKHTVADFVQLAEELAKFGADSICIKDMAALLKPQPAYDLVKGIKQACGDAMRVHVHVHATTGVTLVSLMKAIEAGADAVDTSLSALSLGSGHNPTESLVEMLEGTGYTTKLDMKRVYQANEHFLKVRPRYKEFLTAFTGVETGIFQSQIPGGMLSNMESQLAQQGAADRMKEVLEEVPRVRKDCGYPPLVTPSSQIVGTQAVFNVIMGRYKVITGEFADLMLGYYGATPGEKEPEVLKACGAHAKKAAITTRPADLLKPEWEALRAEALGLPGCNGSDEDVLTFAMFPKVGPKFFSTRDEGPKNVGRDLQPETPVQTAATAPTGQPVPALKHPVTYRVTHRGAIHTVTVEPGE